MCMGGFVQLYVLGMCLHASCVRLCVGLCVWGGLCVCVCVCVCIEWEALGLQGSPASKLQLGDLVSDAGAACTHNTSSSGKNTVVMSCFFSRGGAFFQTPYIYFSKQVHGGLT